jgi:hypothetical protein
LERGEPSFAFFTYTLFVLERLHVARWLVLVLIGVRLEYGFY